MLAVMGITMKQRHSSDQESGLQKAQHQAGDIELEPVTVAMLDEAEGVGIADNCPNGVFFANGEEFLAYLESDQDSH